MRGTVYKKPLPSGTVRWQLQVDAGRDKNGKRIRITKSFARKRAADDALAHLLGERRGNNDRLDKPTPDTLAEFLPEWLTQHAERYCEPIESRKTK